MQKGLQTFDYLVFLFYFIVVASYGYWIYNRKKSQRNQHPRLLFSGRFIDLVGDWSLLNCLQYFCRTDDWNVGQRVFDGAWHLNLRMDGGGNADCSGSIFYAHLFEKQNLDHAPIFEPTV